MHWTNRLNLALATVGALLSSCLAQEVAVVDLTAVEARVDLRRPKATSSEMAGRHGGAQSTTYCGDSAHKTGALETSLVSLDRTYYQVGDEPRFEVTLQNSGSEAIRIPVSPHLADLQPKDPAKAFGYHEILIALSISSGDRWSTNQGGTAGLYGDDDHANTMLSLQPGEWVRVIAKGNIRIDDELLGLIKSGSPADHAYAETSLFREETMLTSTQSATVAREICVTQTHEQTVPIQLVLPYRAKVAKTSFTPTGLPASP